MGRGNHTRDKERWPHGSEGGNVAICVMAERGAQETPR